MLVREILLIIAGVAVNLYPLVYLTRPWYTTAPGRALMVKAWGNLILVDLSLALYIFGEDYPGREFIATIGLAVFASGVWYLLIVLLRTPGWPLYNEPRHKEPKP